MTVLAWHFVGARLRDGRPIPADGEWLVHKGPVVWCESGLYASRRPWHALQYTTTSTLCRVECDDIEQDDSNKFVCRRRRIIERADVTETLRYFARMQALSVIHMWTKCPPNVVLDYLMTGDESLRSAARDATRYAARYAARDATRYATRYATRDAAWAAAWAAARYAAWAATRYGARYGARDAAWAAAWDAAGHEFDALVYEQFGITGEQT